MPKPGRIKPERLANKAWERIDKSTNGRQWPEKVMLAARAYIDKLAEPSSGDSYIDNAEIELLARTLNDELRDWTGVKCPQLTKILRLKFAGACYLYHLDESYDYKFFTALSTN